MSALDLLPTRVQVQALPRTFYTDVEIQTHAFPAGW
jgi:hypothetical protein